jgi:hypothetical protein
MTTQTSTAYMEGLERVIETVIALDTPESGRAKAMRVCGGAAFRKEVGVERHFRDARAATVMAPTTDSLGKAVSGLPLF